ncbi:YqaA family protein [Thiobacter aerophilum]|uniref:DedA family protein n=1 Tax=Thiobacter aerophilum TaxID=3121275 RepID=A0ABV0EGT9_9BURK
MLALAGLFAASFFSATLLPGHSEAALFVYLRFHPEAWATALAVATLGNTLGGMTSYVIGRMLPGRMEGRALAQVRRFGIAALLLAWLPVLGDALPLAAGWLRLNPWLSALFMAVGKLARYLFVAALAVA